MTTPGALAAALGDPIAARWVGYFLLHHPHPAACPCHRVVGAEGRLGRYLGGSALDKLKKLRAEGVALRNGRVELSHYGWRAFSGDRPLARLRERQAALPSALTLEPLEPLPPRVAGVDVSYPSPGEGVAAYALVDLERGRLLWSTHARRPVTFPYITGYLAFRELPLLVDLLARARDQGRLAPLVLVDGTGVLHPRHAGLASHLGLLAGVPTVGVIKTLLCGQVRLRGLEVGQARPVLHRGRPVGMALKSRSNAKPIYLSPGQRIDLGGALAVVRRALRGHKLPEPLYWADRLSRQVAQRLKAGARPSPTLL